MLNLTFTVTNAGPQDASDVTLEVSLPSVVEFASGDGCAASGGAITCTQGDLASGDSATIEVVLSASTAGSGSISAEASAAEDDPAPDDNSQALDVSVTAPSPAGGGSGGGGGGAADPSALGMRYSCSTGPSDVGGAHGRHHFPIDAGKPIWRSSAWKRGSSCGSNTPRNDECPMRIVQSEQALELRERRSCRPTCANGLPGIESASCAMICRTASSIARSHGRDDAAHHPRSSSGRSAATAASSKRRRSIGEGPQGATKLNPGTSFSASRFTRRC